MELTQDVEKFINISCAMPWKNKVLTEMIDNYRMAILHKSTVNGIKSLLLPLFGSHITNIDYRYKYHPDPDIVCRNCSIDEDWDDSDCFKAINLKFTWGNEHHRIRVCENKGTIRGLYYLSFNGMQSKLKLVAHDFYPIEILYSYSPCWFSGHFVDRVCNKVIVPFDNLNQLILNYYQSKGMVERSDGTIEEDKMKKNIFASVFRRYKGSDKNKYMFGSDDEEFKCYNWCNSQSGDSCCRTYDSSSNYNGDIKSKCNKWCNSNFGGYCDCSYNRDDDSAEEDQDQDQEYDDEEHKQYHDSIRKVLQRQAKIMNMFEDLLNVRKIILNRFKKYPIIHVQNITFLILTAHRYDKKCSLAMFPIDVIRIIAKKVWDSRYYSIWMKKL